MASAIQRRNYKERAQPKDREKWGILEKHKDYSLRAKDYNEKKRRVKSLRQKAADRNPDEFHFAMMGGKTDGSGRKIADRGNQNLSQDAVKLLKTQDAGYLRNITQRTKKAREKLEQQLIREEAIHSGFTLISTKGNKSHQIFADGRAYQAAHRSLIRKDEALSYVDVFPDSEKEECPDGSNQIVQNLTSRVSSDSDRRTQQKGLRRQKEMKKSMLKSLIQRENDMIVADHYLDIQRGRMNSSIGSITKAGLKFKYRERRR